MLLDLAASFQFAPVYPLPNSFVGSAATYLSQVTLDTAPLGAFFADQANATGDWIDHTQLSGNINAGRDIGAGGKLSLVVNCQQAAVGGTSVDFQLITSASPDLTSPAVLLDCGTFTPSTWVRGVSKIIRLQQPLVPLRYLGFQAVTVGTFTAGSYTASFALDTDSVVRGYASGIIVK